MRLAAPLALLLALTAAPLTGCGSLPTPYGPIGAVNVATQGPLTVTSNGRSTKVGRASSTGVLGVVFGDASIAEAQRDGGISTIHHVDYEITNIFLFYVKYTTIVYGE